MMVILIALDEFCNIFFNTAFYLEKSSSLVQKTKNTIFDPVKVPLFSEQHGVILVYSGSSHRDLQESYPMSLSISYTY
jgi:hypothetical protein